MNKHNKQKTISDPKELAAVSPPSKIISHASVLPVDYNEGQFSLTVDGFVEKAKLVIRKYEQNESIIARADLETQDLLHEVHLLPAANAVDGYKFYKRLREVQLNRRRAKHENTLMKPLYSYLQQNKGIIGELTHLKNLLLDAEEKVDSYKYTYRIQD